MAVDWVSHYDRIYNALGVSAVLTTIHTEVELTVIDKTVGVPFADEGGIVNSIKPACAVRVPELTTRGVAIAQLGDATIAFNGKSWHVETHKLVPAPTGEAQGEIYFFLMED